MGDKTRGGVYPLPLVFLLRIQYREFLQMYQRDSCLLGADVHWRGDGGVYGGRDCVLLCIIKRLWTVATDSSEPFAV